MKVNLPTTWTSQKMNALFLLSLLRINKAKAGKAFENCIVSYNSPVYNSLINFPFFGNNDINNNRIIDICCHSTGTGCNLNTDGTPGFCPDNYEGFYCNKLTSEMIYCSGRIVPCNGIIGNISINSNNTIGICQSNITSIANYLENIPSRTLVGIDSKYAHLSCSSGSPCAGLFCDWDNGGWTCANNHDVNQSVTNECFIQWPAPFPNNAFVSTSLISSVSPTTSFSSTTNLPQNNASVNIDLVKKIVIPVGAAVVIFSVGCCYLMVRRNYKQVNQTEEMEMPQYQAQMQVPPQNYYGRNY